jgi:quinohemoprotein ethanol dehydrogenase
MKTVFALFCGMVAAAVLGCVPDAGAAPAAGQVDWRRVQAADAAPQNWYTGGRDAGEQHYSPLAQINESNVKRLGLAWEYDSGNLRGRVQRGQESTPIVVDGVMYNSGPWGAVYALSATTGKPLWHFEPELDGARARKACCDVVNRGVAVWKGVVYVGQFDGYLVALNAATGKVLWKTDTLIDRARGYTLSGAPRIAGDVVVIGNGGAEFGVRGYITAYDLRSGKQRWRFFTVPGAPEKGYEHPELEVAARTWDPNSNWDAGGGGTVWDSMVYDPVQKLLFVGTGNGSPHPVWLRSPGKQDNLYLSSILAINPATGRLVWHFQVTPGDSWDYTATQPILLADLEIDGKKTPVLMQAPKNGFFFVIERATGKLVSAEKYVTATWAERFDIATGRPVKSEQGNYSTKAKLVYPSPLGGHNWMPMAYSRQSGLVYIPVVDFSTVFESQKAYKRLPDTMDFGSSYIPLMVKPPAEAAELGAGQPAPRYQEFLLAWDPVAQKEVWRAPNTGMWNGGVLATGGGLVVQGTASGHLRVYRAADGVLLKDIFTGTGMMAAPMTYAVNGVQYLAVSAGYGGLVGSAFPLGAAANDYQNRGRLLVFRLDGRDTPLPPKNPPAELQPLPSGAAPTADQLSRGAALFTLNCARCHGGGRNGTKSAFPDLFNMAPATHAAFMPIVLEGAYSYGGMAGFGDVLKAEDAEAIQLYLVDTARKMRDGQSVQAVKSLH